MSLYPSNECNLDLVLPEQTVGSANGAAPVSNTAITTLPSSMRSLQIVPAVSALFCVCAKFSQALDAGRPNILVIHFDSFAGRDAILDPEQDAIIQPNLQSLIENGVQFTDTYFASSECVPSRSSCKRLGDL